MILQALAEYYDRKVLADTGSLPGKGWELKRIPFLIEIRQDGAFVQFVDTRTNDDSRVVAAEYLVPQSPKRSVNIAPGLLWDNAEYVLGIPIVNATERVARAHAAFRDEIVAAFGPTPDDIGVAAVLQFLAEVPQDALRSDPAWAEVAGANPFMTFRLVAESEVVCGRPAVVAAVDKRTVRPGHAQGICLVTGERSALARLHQSIRGVRGASTTGGSIVSFNLSAFESYARVQGENAPVGVDAAFRYSTALNAMLRPDSGQCRTLVNTTFVFWAERAADERVEKAFSLLFADPARDDPGRGAAIVDSILSSLRSGVRPPGGSPGRFYVLGLSPNAARLAVRAWAASSADDIALRIVRHFDDLEIVRPPRSRPHPTLYRLIRALAPLERAEDISPALEGELARAAIDGRPYPTSVLAAAVGRARAEQDITPDRAALIKATLNRRRRSAGGQRKEVTVALDPANPEPAYRLGRLFATLERVQEIASPGIVTTVRDRFYGAASSTPVTVFPRLISLASHHISKIDAPGQRVWAEKLIGEIVDGLPSSIPAHLSLDEQGAFAIGYYHQRQDFFRKRSSESEEAHQA